MDRVQRLTAHLDIRNGTGLEIGPLANPVVRPAYGQVFYADHVSTEELRQKYATDASIDKAALMEISYVWAEKSLAQTCEGRIFDYVVASHVFEHTPDPISWLREIAEVLKTGGRVVLAIPDKR